jgi:fatty acid desaturase
MTDSQVMSGTEVYSDFNDYLAFQAHGRLNKKEMFDSQFVDFMKWLKNDIHSRYSRKDFQRYELNSILQLTLGYGGMLAAYTYLHLNFSQYAWWWGVPLFIAAIFIVQKGEVMHMRAHSPNALTGVDWVDDGIDMLGLPLTGISPALFKRRHCAAHYNDIGNISRIFSEVWITFDKVPVNYHFRPHLLLRFLLNKEFCKEEMINRRQLLIETLGFYAYIIILATELVNGSYFLLVFHLIPSYVLASSQVLSAIIVHSGIDRRNSFESNGIFDYKSFKGLFKVPMMFYCLVGNGGIINHGIHHAYPQVPLDILNKEYQRLNQHILENYTGVRYNTVMTMRIQKDLLARLGAPNPFDYVVAFFCSLVALGACMFTVTGLPVPPTIFELLLVDYRIYFNSTKAERFTNAVAFWDTVRLEERYHQTPEPNTYLKWVYKRYCRMKTYLAKQSVSTAAVKA